MNPHLSTGAYAMNALPTAERSEFEAHRAICPGCADEVAGLIETVAFLGDAAAHVPSPRRREDVLTAARSVRQLAPLVEPVVFRDADLGRRRGINRAVWLVLASAVVAAVVLGAHDLWSGDQGSGPCSSWLVVFSRCR